MSDMPSYDRAKARSLPIVPFSNGTEYQAWSSGWCERSGAPCGRDTIQRGTGDLACPLLDVATLDERTPAEWGERKNVLGPGMYECTKYEAE
jgi:hypothetical protein